MKPFIFTSVTPLGKVPIAIYPHAIKYFSPTPISNTDDPETTSIRLTGGQLIIVDDEFDAVIEYTGVVLQPDLPPPVTQGGNLECF